MSTTYSFGAYTCVLFTTADGSFTWTPPAGVTSYDVLIVAGGGGGAEQANGGGGGGAGGLLWLTSQACTPGVGISGSVGAGGAGGNTGSPSPGTNGTNSVFASSTAIGGGKGGAGSSGTAANNGGAGGSGGGGSGSTTGGNASSGGAGTVGQGHDGGGGNGSTNATSRSGGGGGGAGGAGQAGSSDGSGGLGGDGGAGFDASALVGTTVGESGWFASGGGGGVNTGDAEDVGFGPTGGGGDGGRGSLGGTAGAANTGGGGGGGGNSGDGAAGGSGVIIVRYTITSDFNGTATLAGGDTFAASGTVGRVASAALAATATFAAVGVVGISNDAALEGTGDFEAAGAVLAANEGSATLDGTGTFTAEGVVGRASGATLTGTGTLAASGAAGYVGAATLDGTGTFAAAGEAGDAGSSSATLVGTVTFTATGTAFSYDTDTSNADDGIWLGDAALSEIVWEPDVMAPPVLIGPQVEADVRVAARIIDTPPTGWGTATFTPAEDRILYTTAMRPRLLIGDEDWTFHNGVPAQFGTLRFIDPLLYGSGEVTLPSINPMYPPAELGALQDYFQFKRVVVQLVIDGDPATVIHPAYYKGLVTRVDTSGSELRLSLGGEAAGRLSMAPIAPFPYRRRQKIQHIIVDTLRYAKVRAQKHDDDDSPVLIRRGGTDGLQIVNEHVAIWGAADEEPVTFVPGDDGVYRQAVKDTSTVHWTVFLDGGMASQQLAQDFAEQPNHVYVRGETARGELIANRKTPGMTQAAPLPFPLASGVLELGMTNADTTTGAGITTLQQHLAIHDFYDYDDGRAGTFEDETEAGVRAFQRFANLTVTGTVNETTWNRLFRLDRIGYSLDDAREYPTAADPRLDRYDRTANGSKYQANPLFDPHLPRVGLWIDGGRMSKKQAQRLAVSKLRPEGGVWVGQITLRSGLWRGDVDPGDATLTSADVGDRREVLPNENVRIPYFAGSGVEGVVFSVTGKDDGPEETTLLVSTQPSPTIEAYAAWQRIREAKSNLGRLWSGHVRLSQVRQDTATSWDTSSGWLGYSPSLTGAEWTEIAVPAGQSGIVERIHIELGTEQEFAVVLSQEKLGLARLNSINPLAITGENIWTEDADTQAWFRQRGVLDAWGWHQQPCGYDDVPKNKGGSPNGVFFEKAGLNYTTGRDPVLYLYVWVGDDDSIVPGRILRNQRTTDY